MTEPIDRRAFLRLAGTVTAAAAAAATVSGCDLRREAKLPPQRSSGLSAPTTLSPLTTPTPPSTGAATARPSPTATPPADLDQLGRLLGDRLVLPNDPAYAQARLVYSPRFDGVRPAAVARCASVSDVRHCVDFARATGMPIAARSGGHSYAGYSTTSGLVVDVGALGEVGPGAAAGTVRIGAGTTLVDGYAKLAALGLSIPGGSCPTVGVTGSTLGGGIGVVGRKYGLSCDRLVAVEVVTADGEAVRADERTEPDLLWAHRGGGGGNFGIVTALEFATHPAGRLSHFVLRWDWARAAEVIATWQGWLPAVPDEVWSNLHLDGGSPGAAPKVYVTGVFVGTAAQLAPHLDALVHAVAPTTSRFAGEAGYLQTMLIEGGCATIALAACRPDWQAPSAGGGGALHRESNLARSDFIARPLPHDGIETLLGAIEGRAGLGLAGGAVIFDGYGGAINRVGTAETAFVHRDALACLQYVAPASAQAGVNSGVNSGVGPGVDQGWLDGLWRSMRPFVSGFAYQNYIDPDLPDWQHAYYGANLDRLIDVKTAVDPANVFAFAQGISPRSGAGGRG